ncbi:MAG: MMPL family transporter [Bacteroidales bacterium]|nr:MMPL family transporter [Bacteroidales bacterium]
MYKIINFILRYRLTVLITFSILTIFLAYRGVWVPMSYEYAQMLPQSDSESITYQEFKKQFEEDGAIFFIGFKDSAIFRLNHYNEFSKLKDSIRKIEGVKLVLSFQDILLLKKDTISKKFFLKKLFSDSLSQEKIDSLFKVMKSLLFYKDFLFTDSHAYVLLIYISNEFLNSIKRNEILSRIEKYCQLFSDKTGVTLHFSGMPYIRTMITELAKIDIKRFTIWAFLLVMILLLIFFRSIRITVISLIIVLAGVAWTLGLMDILGFKITILSGVLPVIIIIIGIENAVYLIIRYHQEVTCHKNQALALVNVLKRTGLAIFLANLTTAIGFGSFMVAPSVLFREFGLIAFTSILSIFLLTIVLIPVLFSYFPLPLPRHMHHLSFKWRNKFEDFILRVIEERKKIIYLSFSVIGLISVVGIFLIQNRSSMLDDVPQDHRMLKDFVFFEENFSGVLPMEITIDTKKKKGIFSLSTLRRIDSLQSYISSFQGVSRPISVVDVVKYAKQAFYQGDSSMYELPNDYEKGFILSYLPNLNNKKENNTHIIKSFIDSSYQIVRISFRLKNLTTPQIKAIKDSIAGKMKQLFPEEKYTCRITGASVVFEKGTRYLVDNLFYSVVLTIIVITILMFFLFRDYRLILIIMIANIFPLVFTAGFMGYTGIPLKPSTIIIYSIALGIAIDSAIQLLSRFRQHLRSHLYDMKTSLKNALRETSPGMIYSGIVLMSGFFIFVFSFFGGTRILGYLVTVTLLMAILSNLMLLPSLILSYEKYISRKAIEDSMLELEENE